MKLVLSIAVVLILSSFASSEDPTTCPQGFVQLGQKCYNLLDLRMNFFNGVTACEDLGSDIAEIVSQEEQDQIANYLNQQRTAISGVWMGINNLQGTWRYRSSENEDALESWNAWYPGYPKASMPPTQCGVLYSRRYWMWEHSNCSNLELPVLCAVSLRDD